jgi:hypothetical protein
MMEKRRLQMWDDMMEEEQALEAEVVVEELLADEHTEDFNMAIDQPSSDEQLSGNSEGEPKSEEEPKNAETTEGDANEMQLWVQDGKLVASAPVVTSSSNPSPSSASGAESSGPSLCAEEPMPQNLDAMQFYVKDGARVAPPSAQLSLSSGVPVAPSASCALPSIPKPLNKYAPRAKSPLGQSPIIPPRVGRLQIPGGEASSAGRAWRRLTSMMFWASPVLMSGILIFGFEAILFDTVFVLSFALLNSHVDFEFSPLWRWRFNEGLSKDGTWCTVLQNPKSGLQIQTAFYLEPDFIKAIRDISTRWKN